MKTIIRKLVIVLVSAATFAGFPAVISAADYPVQRSSTVHASKTQFSTLMEAYNDSATVTSDILMCQAGSWGESLLFDKPLELSLVGGYDSLYSANPGITSVNSMTIAQGAVNVSRIQLLSPVCGNATVDNGEGCDDGNRVSGDGCSSACSVESGFFCSGSPSVCSSVCGDGYVASNEQCDDGNMMDGDGCNAGCTVEQNYGCIGSPSVCELLIPGVAGVSPADAAADVSVPAAITVTFDSAMNIASLTAQTTASFCSGSIQVSADNFATCTGLGSPVVTHNASGHIVATLTPAPALSYGSAYKVRVTPAAQNILGNGVSTYTTPTGFTTATPGVQCSATGGVVISQIYGGGGNSGSTYRNDFIELHNNGASTVSLAGWSLQYASAAGNSWQVTVITPGATIPPGGYHLIQEGGGGGGTTFLPTPDTAGSIPLGAYAGKIALVNSMTALSGGCPANASIVDLVGYGVGVSCYKGIAPAPAPSNTAAIIRGSQGCQNGGKNSTDFTAAAPIPRNSATSAYVCGYTVNECGTAYEADFCNVQYPFSLNIAAGSNSGAIYGQIYKASVTEPAGASSSITAQVGYGPVSVNPENQSGWQWFPATYNIQVGNNDEYAGSFTAPAAGTYYYTYRFSLDGGSRWTYCDLNGAGANAGLTFDVTQLPVLTVY